MPVERLAELRSELAANRLRFQAAVQGVVEEFQGVASEGEPHAISLQIVDIAKERVEATRKTYRRSKVSTAVRAVGMTLTPPAIASTVASALGIGIFEPASIAIAVSLFGADALSKQGEARAKRAESPWSYVLDVAAAVR